MLRNILIVCMLGLPFTAPVHAASVRPLELNEIIDTSTVAFQGTCIDKRTERDPANNMIVTYTTFAVTDVIKGTVKPTHTIKQIGGTLPNGEGSFRIDGVPTFAVGHDYVVFLAGVSSAGFSSPIGLMQGKFSIQQKAGGKTVSNGRDFRDMAVRTPLVTSTSPDLPVSEIGLDEFKQLARDRVNLAK